MNLNSIQSRHSGVEYYICDEMGMMGAEAVGLLDQRLKLAHASQLSCGGKSVIFFGHQTQLPPVKGELQLKAGVKKTIPHPGPCFTPLVQH